MHLHDFAIIPVDFIVRNVSYNDMLYMCSDDPSRNGATRFGWFSRGEIDGTCSWISVNQARTQWGSKIVTKLITESLQFTEKDAFQPNGKNINLIWKQFEGKIMALSDIVNYVPAFEACMYQGFETFRKDNVQYLEV